MESKIMVTIPCQFSSSWSSNKCHVCLLAKSIVWVLPPGGLSKVPNSPKCPATLPMGFPEKKKKKKTLELVFTLRNSACVPGDWEDATRFVLVVSFLISMVQLVQKDPTHIPYTLYTRIHIQRWKRAVLLGSLLRKKKKKKKKDHEEGEAEVKKVKSVLLCLGRRAVLEQAVHDQLLWLFDNVRKFAEARTAQICSRAFMIRVLVLDLSLDLISKTPLRRSTCCRENTWMYVRPCSWAKKTQGQRRRQAARLKESAKQLLFWSGSDRVTVLVPRQTEVSISVWGKPLELGNSLLSTNQRPFIYTGPQALSWRPSTIRSQVAPGSRLRSEQTSRSFIIQTRYVRERSHGFCRVASLAHACMRSLSIGMGFWELAVLA